MKRISTIFAFLLTFALVGCEADYSEYDNGVFLTEARKGTSMKVVIDDQGGQGMFSARVSKKTATDVTVKFGVDTAALTLFNKINGSAYNVLPEAYYKFSSEESVIKAGQIGCEPVSVQIMPFDEGIDQNKKYAIPVVLESAQGGDVLGGARHLMVLIDQVIVTDAIYITSGANVPVGTFAEPKMMGKWTLEWLVNMDSFTRNNVTQWVVKNTAGAQIVYTRFGDVTCPQNCFQMNIGSGKPQSGTGLTAKKWYHLAMVYDGSNLQFFINGVLDVTAAHSKPGEEYEFASVNFSNNRNNFYALHGQVCEMRVWSVARSGNEILNNMYTVDPTTPGLEIYWKANDGEGRILHDYSGNGRDGVCPSAPAWRHGIRFPEGM